MAHLEANFLLIEDQVCCPVVFDIAACR